jgi:hypothetical protein
MPLIEREDGSLFHWPNCSVPDCPNLICCGFSYLFCYQHMSEQQREAHTASMKVRDGLR